MKSFFEKSALQDHPLRLLIDFLEREAATESARRYEDLRFVGYVLDISYDTVTIITSDPFKVAVGGVPRNSLLIMVPANMENLPPHLTLLRVLEAAPTPLSQAVQQTYFELQKKSMPELDVFTQSELQWGALKTAVLGMFYPNPDDLDSIEFSGDLNNFVSAHKYRVYAPDNQLLDLIVNCLVPEDNRFELGRLRLTECRLGLPNRPMPDVAVHVSTTDFMGTRTAMFGKTRLGKSNVVKLIAQSLIETTTESHNVGQLIFDINGEYANDNPQDDSRSLRSAFQDRCIVYALTPKEGTTSYPLRLNFYEQPDSAHRVLGSLLAQDGRDSGYIKSFTSVELPNLNEIRDMARNEQIRARRKILFFWAILRKAGFIYNEEQIRPLIDQGFNPSFSQDLRQEAYRASSQDVPNPPVSINELRHELEIINSFRRSNPNAPSLRSTGSGNPTFEPDDIALLEFLDPVPGRSGVTLIQSYRIYHDPNARNFVADILARLDRGETVILDLGNANEEVMRYFSNQLSAAVFRHQLMKFTENRLGEHYIQLYFEEAHNLFPSQEEPTDTYSRFAKEGAKYHIGMVYSTQSPTTVYRDLLAQTENFFIAHLSSADEARSLGRLNVAYASMADDILMAKTPGYMRMLTRSHRFVIPVQAHRFAPRSIG